jgi:uncharacterized protein with PIN domain
MKEKEKEEKKPFFWNEKPPKCKYCGSETEFEETSWYQAIGNVKLKVPQDWYRCKKCYSLTAIGGW